MKISDVLEFMQLSYSLKGNADYSENVSLNDLDINWESPKPTDEEFHQAASQCLNKRQVQNYSNAMQSHIDSKARAKSYDNGWTCATYINSSNATWQQEAADFIAWRDECWQYAYDIQSQIEDDEIEPPSIEEFINNAPTLNWS